VAANRKWNRDKNNETGQGQWYQYTCGSATSQPHFEWREQTVVEVSCVTCGASWQFIILAKSANQLLYWELQPSWEPHTFRLTNH
jgi:hypothetical protein